MKKIWALKKKYRNRQRPLPNPFEVSTALRAHGIDSRKIKAHDEQNECKAGDLVTIQETRPLSKSKSWTLVTVEQRAAEV